LKTSEDIDYLVHDLKDPDWIGQVINITDSTFSGRCQVRVFGLMDNIKNEHIPWATPINSTVFSSDNGAGSLSIPKLGSLVKVSFNNGDIYAPEYSSIQNIDPDLINKIRSDYIGTHILLYDSDQNLSIIFQPSNGITISFKDSFFQISPDSLITIQSPDNQSTIQLDNDITNIATQNKVNISAATQVTVQADECIVKGSTKTKIGPGGYYSGVCGEPLVSLLLTLAQMIDSKMSLTPGVATNLVETTKSAILSTNCLISQ